MESLEAWFCKSAEARLVTELCWRRRACSWAVSEIDGTEDWGSSGGVGGEGSLHLSGLQLAITVAGSGTLLFCLVAIGSLGVSWPPKVLDVTLCALWMASCL